MKANLLKSVMLVSLVLGSVFTTNLSAKNGFVTNNEVKNEQVISKTIYRLDDYLYRHAKYDYTYNENGYVSVKEAFKWDDRKQLWKPDFRIDFTYNNGEVVMEYAKWNAKDQAYNVSKERSIYEFNGNNEVMTYTNEKWNDKMKKWDINNYLDTVDNGNVFAISQ